MEKVMDKMKKAQSHPTFGYPKDNGYLSEGRIEKDLKKLKSVLLCYRKNGAAKIKLNYN